MSARNLASSVLGLLAFVALPGCMIRLGPKWAEIEPSSREPLVRLGEVTQTLTGTWAAEAKAGGWGHKHHLLRALRETDGASYFSTDPASLVMDIDIVSDHATDAPGMVIICTLSVASLGLVPLPYHSEWSVDASATVRAADRAIVAEYATHSTGTYDFLGLPPTMLALIAGACRAARDNRAVQRRVGRELAAKLVRAIDADYTRLAKWREAGNVLRDQQPLVVQVAGATYWVLYDIETVQATAPTRRRYVLNVYRSRPTRGATPHRALVVGEQRGAGQPDAAWQWREPKSVVLYAEGRLWYPECRVEGPYDKLASVRFQERKASAADFFRHGAFPDLPPGDFNDCLISWKNRELATVVRDASARELREHLDRIERVILKANEAAEAEKDKAQKLAADGKSGAELHAQTARLYVSRIAILKPILAAVKAEIANRQR